MAGQVVPENKVTNEAPVKGLLEGKADNREKASKLTALDRRTDPGIIEAITVELFAEFDPELVLALRAELEIHDVTELLDPEKRKPNERSLGSSTATAGTDTNPVLGVLLFRRET